MNGNTDIRPEVGEYLTRVRSALADLPADELAELMEDVESHLTEVFAEGSSSEELTNRLGTPEAYAAELRTAGGYPPPAPPARSTGSALPARSALWILALTLLVATLAGIASVEGLRQDPLGALFLFGLVSAGGAALVFTGRARLAEVGGLREVGYLRRLAAFVRDAMPGTTVGYLRSLRPAWWLVRIVVLALGGLAALSYGGRPVTGLLLIAIAIAALVVFGARARADRRFAWIVWPCNAFAVGVGFALVVAALSGSNSAHYYDTAGFPGLSYNGYPLSNVYAVDASGRAIDTVYLYDEHGAPLNVRHDSCADEPDAGYHNRFPLPTIDYANGQCRERRGLPFVPLLPGAGPTDPSAPGTTSSTAPGSSGPTPTSSGPAPTGSAAPTTTTGPTVSTTK